MKLFIAIMLVAVAQDVMSNAPVRREEDDDGPIRKMKWISAFPVIKIIIVC